MTFHPLHPGISAQHVLAETQRELAQRRSFYPGRVAEGRMSQAEADHQLALAAAWHQDAQRIAASDYTPDPLPPATHGVSWQARREGLARELALRARVYPARVAELRMTQAEADHRRACLMALAARLDDGFDWIASGGARTRFGLVEATPEILAARREWQDHCAAVDAARAPLGQEALL